MTSSKIVLAGSVAAGVGVEVGEDLVHPAELGEQHLLHLLVAQRLEHPLGPGGKTDLHLQRLRIARVAIGIA